MHRLQELVRLHRLGNGPREVARLLKMGPNTERQYREALEKSGLLNGEPDALPEFEVLKATVEAVHPPKPKPQYESSIAKWEDEVRTMADAGAWPTSIFDALRLKHEDFSGTLSAVKRMCARVKAEKGIRAEDVAIPVVTEPGDVAQVDFGYVGRLWDPETKRERKAYVFVMVLGHSRHQFARIVFDQKVETWLRLHIEAFEAWGGVPRTVVPDNLKAAVVRAAFGVDGAAVLNRSYRELARHYGFMIDPAPIYEPKKKGKVESGVRYVKNNFFKPRRDEKDSAVLDAELARWVREIAGMRRHGTTQKRPIEVFEQEEKPVLLSLPEQRWELSVWRQAKVHQEAHVQVARALYSVPWRLVAKRMLVRLSKTTVEVYWEDTRVATHRRLPPGQRSTIEAHLPERRRAYRHRTRKYWEDQADALGEDVGRYVREVFDSDDVLYQLRVVQAVVRHLATHPAKRAQAACRRASFYGNYTYRGIKEILKQGLDMQPLPTVARPDGGEPVSHRFARPIQELLDLPLEKTDAPN